MRIAFLCKRRYMGKDVILDRYARLYEIPYQLALRGHDVLGLCFSYYPADADGQWSHAAGAGALQWESRARGVMGVNALAYPFQALRRLRQFDPDVLIGASDIPHIVLGDWLARRLRRPFAADLYDNFESFGLARLPGAVAAYRRAVRRADLVTCTSAALAEHVREAYRARGSVVAMPSTIDKTLFHARDKATCRQILGLPQDALLVGTAGGLYADKGVGTLYAAYERLAATQPNLHLVLAGPTSADFPPPVGPRVHYLGSLPHARVADLFGALDVGVIYLRDTPFGRFCFPQKAYEMLACGLPVVAANVGAMADVLQDVPQALYPAEDAGVLASCIAEQLAQRVMPRLSFKTWKEQSATLEHLLTKISHEDSRT